MTLTICVNHNFVVFFPFSVLDVESRALHMTGKLSNIELCICILSIFFLIFFIWFVGGGCLFLRQGLAVSITWGDLGLSILLSQSSE